MIALKPKNGERSVCKWCGQDLVYSELLHRWVALTNHTHMPLGESKNEEPREAGDPMGHLESPGPEGDGSLQ